MSEQQLFQERVVKVDQPQHHFQLLIAPDGQLLSMTDQGVLELSADADDRVVWDQTPTGFRQVATDRDITADVDAARCVVSVGRSVGSGRTTFAVCHGPEKLPSEYLAHMQREGWVCLTSILAPEVVEGLERVAGTDRYEHLEVNNGSPKVCQSVSVGRAITEPVSLWLIRQYMRTRDLHLGHPPGFRVLAPDDGQSRLGGSHSDIPYTSSTGGGIADRKGPIKAVQRNVCVSDFTKFRGATVFKLGSHLAETSPPPEWNQFRDAKPGERGLPYGGPEADVVEAPGGSIILYDARTWHRAGINRSQHKRGAMLSSFQTVDVVPKTDTKYAYGRLLESPIYQELNAREQHEIADLFLNQPSVA